jgi:hypothetical protein
MKYFITIYSNNPKLPFNIGSLVFITRLATYAANSSGSSTHFGSPIGLERQIGANCTNISIKIAPVEPRPLPADFFPW